MTSTDTLLGVAADLENINRRLGELKVTEINEADYGLTQAIELQLAEAKKLIRRVAMISYSPTVSEMKPLTPPIKVRVVAPDAAHLSLPKDPGDDNKQ